MYIMLQVYKYTFVIFKNRDIYQRLSDAYDAYPDATPPVQTAPAVYNAAPVTYPVQIADI